VVSFMPWLLYPQGKSLWYPLDRRLGGLQIQSGHSGKEKKNIFPDPSRNLTLVVQPIVQSLYWLSYPSS